MPRSYVVDLQRKVRQLESEIVNLRTDTEYVVPVEDLVRSAGLVNIRSNADPRFLGPSSGINMTRLVIELAKSLSHSRNINEIIPEHIARGVKQRFEMEASKPTSKIYSSTSCVAAPDLPSIDLTNRLVEYFLEKGMLKLKSSSACSRTIE